MNFLGAVATVLFGYLIAVAPLQGRARIRRLQAELGTKPDARVRYYERGIARSWIIAGIVLVLFFANGARTYGLPLVGDPAYVLIAVVMLAAVGAGALRIKGLASTPERRTVLARKLARMALVLPRSERERRTFVGVALTAGIAEELIFRGFVLIALLLAFGFTTFWPFIVLSGAIFGWAHLYQGPKGMLLTGIVGAVFAVIAVGAGLLLAMAIHALIDLRLLLIPPEVIAEAADRLEP